MSGPVTTRHNTVPANTHPMRLLAMAMKHCIFSLLLLALSSLRSAPPTHARLSSPPLLSSPLSADHQRHRLLQHISPRCLTATSSHRGSGFTSHHQRLDPGATSVATSAGVPTPLSPAKCPTSTAGRAHPSLSAHRANATPLLPHRLPHYGSSPSPPSLAAQHTPAAPPAAAPTTPSPSTAVGSPEGPTQALVPASPVRGAVLSNESMVCVLPQVVAV